MQTTSRSSRLALAVATVAVLMLGACSAGGGDDASTTTTQAGKTTTTVDDGETTTTTEASDPSDGPSSDDLEALLPTAADIGSGWSLDRPDGDSGSSATDDELDRQCPEVAALDDDAGDDSDDVEADFSNSDNQRVSVKLNPTATELSDEKLDSLITATNACTGTIEDPEDGTSTAFSFDVSRTDAFGDQGIQIEGTLTVSGGQVPKPVTITIYSLNYRVGTVGVEVTGQDGVDNSTFASIPFDPDSLITLGRDLETQVKDLVGS